MSGEAAAAVAERNRFFEQRFAAGDARGLVEGYFAADAHSPLASPPGGAPPLRGRQALIGMFQGQVQDLSAVRLETLRLEAAGDIAYELGRAHLTLRAGPEVKGRYAVLWRRLPEGWRVVIDFFAEGWAD